MNIAEERRWVMDQIRWSAGQPLFVRSLHLPRGSKVWQSSRGMVAVHRGQGSVVFDSSRWIRVQTLRMLEAEGKIHLGRWPNGPRKRRIGMVSSPKRRWTPYHDDGSRNVG